MLTLILPVVLPLLGAFLMRPLAQVSPFLARALGPILLITSLVLLLPCCLDPLEQPAVLALGGFAPPMGILFYGDRLAFLFATATALFVLLFWHWRGAPEPRRDALLLLLTAAATGVAFSGDLFNLYVFYELLAVASFGLAALRGTGPALIATLRYLLISALGSLFALLGIAILYLQTGTLNLAQLVSLAPEALQGSAGLLAFALLFIGFGVKGELFPVNAWVPEVYATAPPAVSALLAGLVSKLAALIILRLLVVAYGAGPASQLLLLFGTLTILFGEFAAWRARDFARMIAFSSIGQLGIVFIAFAISGTWGLLAGLAIALHHLIVKSALFSLANRWSGSLDALRGVARREPIAAGLFVLFALSLIGVPPLPGFWTKIIVLGGLARESGLLPPIALGAILLVTAVEASYLFRLVIQLYDRETPPPDSPRTSWDIVPAALLGIVLLLTGVQINPIADTLRAIARQAADPALYFSRVYPQETRASLSEDRS